MLDIAFCGYSIELSSDKTKECHNSACERFISEKVVSESKRLSRQLTMSYFPDCKQKLVRKGA